MFLGVALDLCKKIQSLLKILNERGAVLKLGHLLGYRNHDSCCHCQHGLEDLSIILHYDDFEHPICVLLLARGKVFIISVYSDHAVLC